MLLLLLPLLLLLLGTALVLLPPPLLFTALVRGPTIDPIADVVVVVVVAEVRSSSTGTHSSVECSGNKANRFIPKRTKERRGRGEGGVGFLNK